MERAGPTVNGGLLDRGNQTLGNPPALCFLGRTSMLGLAQGFRPQLRKSRSQDRAVGVFGNLDQRVGQVALGPLLQEFGVAIPKVFRSSARGKLEAGQPTQQR